MIESDRSWLDFLRLIRAETKVDMSMSGLDIHSGKGKGIGAERVENHREGGVKWKKHELLTMGQIV